MEKKKLKLSVSGSSKKTFNSIEQAKSKSKNTVVIEKKIINFQENHNFQGKTTITTEQTKIFNQSHKVSQERRPHQLQILKKENWQNKELQED